MVKDTPAPDSEISPAGASEAVHWKIGGMSCTGCAQTVDGFLRKKGMADVQVSLAGGDVHFVRARPVPDEELKKGIEGLGYQVVADETAARPAPGNKFMPYLALCVPLTAILMLHMLPLGHAFHRLMNGWVQALICLPVFVAGMAYFGRSAVASLRVSRPNMNVLVALGAVAAFSYSLAGTIGALGERYIFYETAASIITLVFFGNYLEERALRRTQRSLDALTAAQTPMATMIAFDDQHQELLFPVESRHLKSGDLILIRTGEAVPADAKVLWGDAEVSEALLTGESVPVPKKAKDAVVGGTVVVSGLLKAQVTAAQSESVLAQIVGLVRRAQAGKPPIQQLADRISNIFVPVVIGIAVLTFGLNDMLLHDPAASLLRAIAVLVIACPCAMGLATPAAIAVGLGRAARDGILFRSADRLEIFPRIRQVIFDKTGTLTTGRFVLRDSGILDTSLDRAEFQQVVFSLEKYSQHPLAAAIAAAWKTKPEKKWTSIEEVKGAGMRAVDDRGVEWRVGSGRWADRPDTVPPLAHDVVLYRDGSPVGWVDLQDEVRPEAAAAIARLRARGIRAVLLSGDRAAKCETLAGELGIEDVHAEQSPEQKQAVVRRYAAGAPTAMVGDGVNDAPALAEADLGISLSDATHLAIQTADVVLMGDGLGRLPEALALGSYTYQTIRQNLFWAFFYNVLAIPIAAFGLLSPGVAAGAMAFSDVILLVNSSRLFVRKLD